MIVLFPFYCTCNFCWSYSSRLRLYLDTLCSSVNVVVLYTPQPAPPQSQIWWGTVQFFGHDHPVTLLYDVHCALWLVCLYSYLGLADVWPDLMPVADFIQHKLFRDMLQNHYSYRGFVQYLHMGLLCDLPAQPEGLQITLWRVMRLSSFISVCLGPYSNGMGGPCLVLLFSCPVKMWCSFAIGVHP